MQEEEGILPSPSFFIYNPKGNFAMKDTDKLYDKVDDIYKMLLEREKMNATYMERLDNHLGNHKTANAIFGWVLGSGSCLAIMVTAIKLWWNYGK